MVTSRDYITDILEICLERLRAGDNVTACLQDYPHCADELAPLLNSAEYARRAPPPRLNLATRQAIQRQLRSAVAGQAPQRRATTSWYRAPVLRFSTLLVAIVLAIGSGAVGVAAAQSSLPGDPLYSVKRAGESLRLTLTTTPDQRANLHIDFAQTRLVETLTLLDNQQPIDERVLDDLAREYELAWANIQMLPAGQAEAHRERLIAEGHVEVAALTEALGRAPHANRPAIEAALRSHQGTLMRAIENNRSTLPQSPTTNHPPTPGHIVPPENKPGSEPIPTKEPATNPDHSQDKGNPGSQPDHPGNGQGNNGNDHPRPSPATQPDKPGNSDQHGGNGQGQSQDPGNGQDNGSGQDNKSKDNDKSKDKDKAPKNGKP